MEISTLFGKTQEEVKNAIKGMPEAELHALEDELVKLSDEYGKELMNKEFKTPTKKYADAAAAIRLLLNKQSVQFQYTLGLVNMYEFFDPEKRTAKMSYGMLDSVLQTLGRSQFQGYDEWKAVVTVNEYFESLREEYSQCQYKIYEYATIHNCIMDELGLNDKTAANPNA